MRTGGTVNLAAPIASESAQHSPWQSPVPYLFGSLAAMFGLIAFALLIIACSYYRKLSLYLQNGDGAGRDPENRNEKGSDEIKVPAVFEEKIVVIMAGDKKPTFLATPISIRTSLNENFEKSERPKEEMGHQEQQQLQEAEQNREISQSQNQ